MNITLPSSGLYTIRTEPGSRYLVETNPRFANYKEFISGDYMLQNLGFDPAKTTKQIGDGFYQQKLIREQLTELTGRQFLNNNSSTQDEYKDLLNNGVTYAKQFNLQVGVALTPEQMATLTSNMVWLVEQEVQGQKVLVPVVYLAPNQKNRLQDNGAIITADNVNITAEQDIVNQNSKITGGDIKLVAGRDIKNETTTYVAKAGANLEYANNIRTLTGQTAEIKATGKLDLDAKRDVQITGGKLSAGTDIIIKADRNLEVGAVATTNKSTAKNYLQETTFNVTSSIKADNNITITTKQDINLSGADLDAGKDLSLTSTSGNINITTVKDEILIDEKTGSKRKWKRTRTDDEYVIGSKLQADGKVSISAVKPEDSKETNPNGNVNIAGSNVYSDTGKITIKADNDVTIQEVKEKHESLVQKHKKTSGFLSSKTKDTRDYSLTNQVVGSSISGDSIEINSGKDLTVKGSTVVATNDVSLHADNDVNITSAQETGKDEHYKKVKKSGLMGGGGLGFSIGTQSTKTTLNEQVKAEIGSTVGSINGNVSITAGNKVNSAGTTIASGKDTNITGKEVTIDNTINTYDSQYKYEFKQSGLSVSLGGPVVETGISMANHLERSGEVEDNRLQVLHLKKAYDDYGIIDKTFDNLGNLQGKIKKLEGELNKIKSESGKIDPQKTKELEDARKDLKDGLDKAFSINVSLGTAKTTIKQNTHIETVNSSNITAGGNLTVKATAGDVNLKATNLNATNITLDAAKDLNIESAQNLSQTNTNTKSSSASIGASFGLGTGSFGGLNGGINSSKGKENQETIIHSESIITAGDKLTLKSGNDTNILGSQVKGKKVEATVGGDLNIESRQDSETFTSKNKSTGINFATGFKEGKDKDGNTKIVNTSAANGSSTTEKIKSNYTSVIDQAGIFAGQDGFNITVGKNTDLKGAVISSEATPDKNKISTDTLTWMDLHNKAKYSASSTGIGYSSDKGFTPNPGMPVSGDASSTTKSAISPGKIIVGGKEVNPTGLSRDPSGALNALGKIFDKASVKERQELAQVFSEEAFKVIGEIGKRKLEEAVDEANKAKDNIKAAKDALANNDTQGYEFYMNEANKQLTHANAIKAEWSTGGTAKILLHGMVGGLVGSLSGGNILSGAIGSGISEKFMGNIKDPALREWASIVIGATAGKIIGGGTGGAFTSLYGTRYNDNDPNHDVDTGVIEKIKDLYKDASNQRRKIVQWGIEGMLDTYEIGVGNTNKGREIGDWARDNGVEYAQTHGLSKTWDNEADAYRHFLWNAGMTRAMGSDAAAVIATRHETANWIADLGASPGEIMTLDVPLASLMDLNNNDLGRRMAASSENENKTYDQIFDDALSSGRLITSLDQVPGQFGFPSEWIKEKNIHGENVLVVTATFDFNKGSINFYKME